jgi:hypothetical protein
MEEKQPEGYVEFSKLVEGRIREDGEEVILLCEGPDGGQFEMVVPTKEIPVIAHSLMNAMRAAMIRVKNPLPVKRPYPVFVDAPPVFVVLGLSGVVQPESGQIDLQIESPGEQEFVVSFPKEIARMLFDLLLQHYNPEEKAN